ncbi:hypothetical protein IWQ62_006828 [Dispira parvispora]|uniref:Bax inhibitor 1 n=1 Tax=Dispira parvispora TaxID=1520584 RepID=A0A9W8AFW8_9FUNG|nr:hypothetical protein IWQ62_006828 [Dispira parvispora]
MATLFNQFHSGDSSFTLENLTKRARLTPSAQSHLVQVYTWLAFATGAFAAGSYAFLTNYLRLSSTLSLLGSAGCMSYLMFTNPSVARGDLVRKVVLLGFSFLQGNGLGPLVVMSFYTNPRALFLASLATTAIFASFSLSALFTRSRSALYLGGLLASAVTVLGLVQLVNFWIIGSRTLFTAELVLGLVVFSLYIIFDTQAILVRVDLGSRDVVGHALTLFVDLAAVFVRTLILLEKFQHNSCHDRRRRRTREN